MTTFEQAHIGNCLLSNRIIRSATYEGACDGDGFPMPEYYQMYSKLSKGNPGLIITGFMFIDETGKAMQPSQAGIESVAKVAHFKKLTDDVHQTGNKIFAQIAHTGRQTINERVSEVLGVSKKKSAYFKAAPNVLTEKEAYSLINKFVLSAKYAKDAGFDGVQIHAAHGYLIHQFLLSSINNRKDIFGIDAKTGIGNEFLKLVVKDIRKTCGNDFPVIVKISGSDDYFRRFSKQQFINLIRFLDEIKIDAIEISYGTMDYALNIFRGDIPLNLILKINPIYGKRGKVYNTLFRLIFPFLKIKYKAYSPMYNLNYAEISKQHTSIPIIVVGGFRNTSEIEYALSKGIDFVSMCRPFICEPDIVKKFKDNPQYQSRCCNCNFCSIMCDSNNNTRCYKAASN